MIKQLALIFLATLTLTGCRQKETDTLKVAATSVPHAEILEFIKPDLEAQGIHLDIVVVEDYATPNRALNDGEVDANFFQHQLFLDSQMKEFHYRFATLAHVHLEPMGLYSKKITRLADLKPNSTVAIPSDPSNEARALLLLEQNNLITLDKHEGIISLLDVVENPSHINFIEMDPPLLVRTLVDVDLAAITGNFALQGNLHPAQDALVLEGADSPYSNILVVRQEDVDRPDLLALKKALTSEKVRTFIKEKYKGSFTPAF